MRLMISLLETGGFMQLVMSVFRGCFVTESREKVVFKGPNEIFQVVFFQLVTNSSYDESANLFFTSL